MEIVRGQSAVITGAGSGIGRSAAVELARMGVNVVAADVRLEAAQSTAQEIRDAGGTCLPLQVDVSAIDAVMNMADTAEREFGPTNILCNNAGVAIRARTLEATHEDWEWMVGVNLWGVIHGVEAFLPRMLASGQPGHIVNTASIFGVMPSPNSTLYSVTKYAVVGLTDVLRNELNGTNVGISVLCPAIVATGIAAAIKEREEALGRATAAVPSTPSAAYPKMFETVLSSDEVGHMLVEGIQHDQHYIFTHAASREYLEARHARMMADFSPLEA